jgi:hypothetical protein
MWFKYDCLQEFALGENGRRKYVDACRNRRGSESRWPIACPFENFAGFSTVRLGNENWGRQTGIPVIGEGVLRCPENRRREEKVLQYASKFKG